MPLSMRELKDLYGNITYDSFELIVDAESRALNTTLDVLSIDSLNSWAVSPHELEIFPIIPSEDNAAADTLLDPSVITLEKADSSASRHFDKGFKALERISRKFGIPSK